jgi:hypothetical protein
MSDVKHRNWDKRRQSYAKAEEADVYNIRKKGQKPFEYSGKAADIILFLQPKLLYRGLKFSNED